jgi:tetratricopeptide (TPR) repeat protein
MVRIVAIALALSSAQPAPAPEPGDRAAQAIREGRYTDAAEAFAQDYERTGDPALLFGQAQALRRAGDCKAAIEVFERFIATAPPQADVAAASAAIDECREILGAKPAVDPAPQPIVAIEPAPAPVRHWSRDPPGAVLMGLGVALTVTGAALFGASYRRMNDRPGSEAELEDHRRRVTRMWNGGLGLLVGGGVVMIAAAIRWGLVARAQQRARARRISTSADGLTIRF